MVFDRIAGLAKQLRALVRKRGVESELDDEIRFHIEMETEQNVRAGMSPEAARRAALVAFGGVERHKEQVRDARWVRAIDTLATDVRSAFRALVRRPGFAAAAVLTLALGIGSAVAVSGAVRTLLLRPLPYPEADRLVAFWIPFMEGVLLFPRAAQVDAWRAESDIFERIEWTGTQQLTLEGDESAERLTAARIQPGFHDLVRTEPLLGRRFTEAEIRGEGERVALLAYELWQRRFGGDPAVLGRAIRLEDEPWTVVGVMPPGSLLPYNVPRQVDMWTPYPETHAEARGDFTIGRLRDGVTLEQAAARLDAIRKRAESAGDADVAHAVLTRRLVEVYGGPVRESLYVMSAAVALLLGLAYASVATLLLTRAARRRHEMAVRSALGAARGRLVRQLLLEVLVLAVLATSLGMLLARVALRVTAGIRPDLWALAEITPDPGFLVVATAAACLLALAAGLIPALHASLGSLAAGGRVVGAGPAGARLRWLLVGAQMALSVALLVGCVAAVRSLVQMRTADPGFDVPGLASVAVQRVDPVLLQRSAERIAALPGVAAVSRAAAVPPGAGGMLGMVEVDGLGELGRHRFHSNTVDHRYFAVLGQRITAGRPFTEAEVTDGAPVQILGETAARTLFGGRDPIGMRMRIEGGTWHTIVGIAADAKLGGLATFEPGLQLYRPTGALPQAFAIRLQAGADMEAVLARVRSIIVAEEPGAVFRYLAPVRERMLDTIRRERLITGLLTALAALAALIATVGLYAVVAQAAQQRTREIAVRVALGARPGQVRRMVVRSGFAATVVGTLAGLGLAVAGVRVLASRLFGFADADPVAYLGAALLLLAVAAAAAYLPARRAAATDPARMLQAE